MHGEMLDDMINGGKDRCVPALDSHGAFEIVVAESCEHSVGILDRGLEETQQLINGRTIAHRKLGRPVALGSRAAQAGDYPLPDVAGQMNDEVSDAV